MKNLIDFISVYFNYFVEKVGEHPHKGFLGTIITGGVAQVLGIDEDTRVTWLFLAQMVFYLLSFIIGIFTIYSIVRKEKERTLRIRDLKRAEDSINRCNNDIKSAEDSFKKEKKDLKK